MQRLSRRHFVGLAGLTVGVGLSGCGDVKTEFLVTNSQLIHQAGDPRFEYPEDIGVRLTLENTSPDQQSAILVVTLAHEVGGELIDSWTKTEETVLGRGSSIREFMVFESAFEPEDTIDNYSIDASLEEEFEPEFVVRERTVVHGENDSRYEYPEDIGASLFVENTAQEEQTGTLNVTLQRDGADADSWTEASEISLPPGRGTRELVVFESVFESGHDIEQYSIEAAISES